MEVLASGIAPSRLADPSPHPLPSRSLPTHVASTTGDCGPSYVGFLERLSYHSQAMSGERLATLHRDGLRIFDACDCGHLTDVRAKFAALEKRLGAPFDKH